MSGSRRRTSELVERFVAREAQGTIAVVDAIGTHSWQQIVAGARATAHALRAGRHSLEGRRVALLAEPGVRFVQGFFGVLLAGGCVVVLSPDHPVAESGWFCADAEIEALLATGSMKEKADALGGGWRRVELGPLPKVPAKDATVATRDDDALQLYTSGTTGRPKGAVLTHGNLSVQQELLGKAWGFGSGDVLLHALPLHHMHGLCIAMLTAVGAGAAIRMLPKFEAAAVWDAMGEATAWMAVPTMYRRLWAAFDAADRDTRERWAAGARTLRLATSGSAALPVGLGERWRELTGAYPLERFGMTEIGVGASNPLHGERRPGTVGKPLETVEVRVVEDELRVCGPSVFREYWRRPEATAEAFVIENGKRWFRTGDTVRIEDDGYVRILGRTSVDILKSGGYKLSALEIEEALREYEPIAEVAVVGLDDEDWGQRVVACVVPKPGREAECEGAVLRAWARDRLAAYKIPRQVVTMSELPRNAMGKVVKPELVKRLSSNACSS